MWLVEFERLDGTDFRSMAVSPNVLTALFSNLDKGTEYRVRVRGENMRGAGQFSGYELRQTLIDRKSLCRQHG